MKRQLITSLFCFLYILAMFRPVSPLFHHLIWYDYITEFLCINKDMPELQCNAKCNLMIELKKQQEEKQKNLPAIAMEEYPIGFVRYTMLRSFREIIASEKKHFQYINRYSYHFSSRNFRPPILSA